MPRAAAGGQHVVGAGAVVAERHRAVRADEDRAGGPDPGGHRGGVGGLDLEVLGRVRVHDGQPVVHTGHQDAAGLRAAQRGRDALGVLGARDLPLELGVHRVGQLDRVGDQHARRERVVLGLADQVGGDVHRVGGAVGEDGDLGRAGLGVDADQPAQQALRRGQVDVARPGDHVDRLEHGAVGVRAAVGEQCHGLRAADRPHLGDAQQRGRGQDRRVRPAAEAGLRRRADHERLDARGLRRHDVHHHARRVDREPARRVQPDPAHRHPALGDRAAGHDLGGDVVAPLVVVHRTRPLDGLLESRPHIGVKAVERLLQVFVGHPHGGRPDVVETLRVHEGRLDATLPHVLHDRPDPMQHRVHVGLGAREHAAQLGRGRDATTQVGAAQHRFPSLRRQVDPA